MPGSQIELPSEPSSISAARAFVTKVLREEGIESWRAVLITSELATNVVLHARTPYTVGVEVLTDGIRIQVQDGAGSSELARRMATHSGGYGLQLVEDLARNWGVDAGTDGKLVWVEVDR